MKNYKSITFMLAFVLLFTVAAATAADAPQLKFKFAKNNVPGAMYTNPNGINNAGVTVGQYQDKKGVIHGYILNGKKLTTLDHPNGRNTWAAGLPRNGAVAVAGYYTNSADYSEGFLYRKGTFTDIPGPAGAIGSVAAGINDKEEIVGYYVDSSFVWHGFLLKGKKYTTLDVPGATNTYADDINNKGDIVLGWLDSSGVEHGSILKGKKYTTLDVPGAADSQADGINNEGDIVLWWEDSSGLDHGALLQGGKYYKFDYPNAYQTYGWGINDKHTISGGYWPTKSSFESGYKATFK